MGKFELYISELENKVLHEIVDRYFFNKKINIASLKITDAQLHECYEIFRSCSRQLVPNCDLSYSVNHNLKHIYDNYFRCLQNRFIFELEYNLKELEKKLIVIESYIKKYEKKDQTQFENYFKYLWFSIEKQYIDANVEKICNLISGQYTLTSFIKSDNEADNLRVINNINDFFMLNDNLDLGSYILDSMHIFKNETINIGLDIYQNKLNKIKFGNTFEYRLYILNYIKKYKEYDMQRYLYSNTALVQENGTERLIKTNKKLDEKEFLEKRKILIKDFNIISNLYNELRQLAEEHLHKLTYVNSYHLSCFNNDSYLSLIK